MWKFIYILFVFFVFGSCQVRQGDFSNYILEVGCTTDVQCNEILRTISGVFEQTFNTSSNVTDNTNDTVTSFVPEIMFQDYNECASTMDYCEENAKCQNVYRTYSCQCVPGFENASNTTGLLKCVDVDECNDTTLNDCTFEESCENTQGSYLCNCVNPSGCNSNATSSPLMPTTTGTSRETTSEETSGEITESTMASVLTSTTQIHHTSTEHSTVGPTSPTETSSSHPNPTSTESTTSLSTSITTISTISTTNSTSSTTISTTVAETTTSSPSTPVVPSTDESAQITSTPAPTTSLTSLNATTAAPTTTTTTTASIPIIVPDDIVNGMTNPADVVENLTSLLEGPPVKEDQAENIIEIVNVFAAASGFIEPNVQMDITQFVERLLNTMELQNGSFVFRSSEVAVAAIDVSGTRTEPLQYSLGSAFSATSVAPPSIILPADLFSGDEQRVSFNVYDNAGLFPSEGVVPITNETFDFEQQVIGDRVINSEVIGSALNGTSVDNLQNPVIISQCCNDISSWSRDNESTFWSSSQIGPCPVPNCLPRLWSQFCAARIEMKVSDIPDEVLDNSTTVRRSLYNPRCTFYDYALQSRGENAWSTDGCTTVLTDNGELNCQCNHLTSFAVLMSVETRIDDHVLTILTYVGCSVSIFGLLASILTYSLFRHLRKHKSKQILLHFCVALCGVYVVYLFGITASLPSNQTECTVSGFFLHFFTSATFAWMFIEVLDMYLLFVKVWSEINKPVKKASIFGWGFPLLLSVATLGAHFGLQNRYPGQDVPRLYPEYRETTICWLSTTGLYWAFFLPMGIVLFINLVLFVIVIYHVTYKRSHNKLTRSHSNSRKIKARQHILNALAILLLTGPTWIIGFLINLDPVSDGVVRRILAYVFVILNAFQGLWIFIVFTVRPKAVRAAWWNLITCKGGLRATMSGSSSWGRLTKTSSSYLSRANRRKSSADIRRSSGSSSVSTSKISASGKLRILDVNTSAVEQRSVNAKKYRYTDSSEPGIDSVSNSTSEGSNAGSDQNLVSEVTQGEVNPTFVQENSTFTQDEKSSVTLNGNPSLTPAENSDFTPESKAVSDSNEKPTVTSEEKNTIVAVENPTFSFDEQSTAKDDNTLS